MKKVFGYVWRAALIVWAVFLFGWLFGLGFARGLDHAGALATIVVN